MSTHTMPQGRLNEIDKYRRTDGRFGEQPRSEAALDMSAIGVDQPAALTPAQQLERAQHAREAAAEVERYWTGQALIATIREHAPTAERVTFLKKAFRSGLHQVRDGEGNLLHDATDSSAAWLPDLADDANVRDVARDAARMLSKRNEFSTYDGDAVTYDPDGVNAPRHVIVPDPDTGHLPGTHVNLILNDYVVVAGGAYATDADRARALVEQVRIDTGAAEDADWIPDPDGQHEGWPVPATAEDASNILWELDEDISVYAFPPKL